MSATQALGLHQRPAQCRESLVERGEVVRSAELLTRSHPSPARAGGGGVSLTAGPPRDFTRCRKLCPAPHARQIGRRRFQAAGRPLRHQWHQPSQSLAMGP